MPIKLRAGETIRLMHTNGGMGGMGSWMQDGTPVPNSQCKGYIIVDDLQFVYGANTADINNPTISSVLANNVEMSNDMVIDTGFFWSTLTIIGVDQRRHSIRPHFQ